MFKLLLWCGNGKVLESALQQKASIDKTSQLQTQIETLHDEKTVLQNTLVQKELCIDSLNKEKTVIQDTLTQKEEHIETLQDRITELQDERKFMSVQTKNVNRREIEKEASEENILKQQTIDNLESKLISIYRNLM